jgi:hypothetical protein
MRGVADPEMMNSRMTATPRQGDEPVVAAPYCWPVGGLQENMRNVDDIRRTRRDSVKKIPATEDPRDYVGRQAEMDDKRLIN